MEIVLGVNVGWKIVWGRCTRQKNFLTFCRQLRCAILEISSYTMRDCVCVYNRYYHYGLKNRARMQRDHRTRCRIVNSKIVFSRSLVQTKERNVLKRLKRAGRRHATLTLSFSLSLSLSLSYFYIILYSRLYPYRPVFAFLTLSAYSSPRLFFCISYTVHIYNIIYIL